MDEPTTTQGSAAPRVAVWHAPDHGIDQTWSAWQCAGLDLRSLLDEHRSSARRWVPDAILFWCPHRLTEHSLALRRCRAQFPLTPLVAAVDCGRDLDHLLAIEGGADDVLDVGWSAEVTAVRLRNARRRETALNPSTGPQQLRYGRLQVCRPSRGVIVEGEPVVLTECEFDLLWLLASHPGVPLERRGLLRMLHGVDAATGRRSIDTRVYRLRVKLGRDGLPAKGLRTVRHKGYLFCAEDW